MNRLEHIGIAVSNLEESNRLFAKLLGKDPYKIEFVESEAVRTSFFELGEIKIELLEATRPDSTIAKFIQKRGPGIHHLAFHVDDIATELQEKISKGFKPVHPTPKEGADNKLISFLHPADTNGVLIELCQEKKT